MHSRESELSKVIVLIIKTGHCFCLEQLRTFLISVSFVHEWSQTAFLLLLLDRSFDHVAVKILFFKIYITGFFPFISLFHIKQRIKLFENELYV